MAYRDDAYDVCRAAFGVTTSDLPDTTLAVYVAGVEADLILAYPCAGSSGVTTLTGTDQTYFAEALGYALAAKIAESPIGQSVLPSTSTVEIGPVKREYGQKSAELFAPSLTGFAQKAMLRVSCVRTAAKARAANLGGMFNLTGKRRAAEEAEQPVIIVGYGST